MRKKTEWTEQRAEKNAEKTRKKKRWLLYQLANAEGKKLPENKKYIKSPEGLVSFPAILSLRFFKSAFF